MENSYVEEASQSMCFQKDQEENFQDMSLNLDTLR